MDPCAEDPDWTPEEHRISSRIVLQPAEWARFCELAGIDPDEYRGVNG